MSEKNTNKTKGNKLVIAIVILIVVILVGYAGMQNFKPQENSKFVDNDSNSIPINTALAQESTPNPIPTIEVIDDSWKDAYVAYIDKMSEREYDVFNLIYLDDNNVPELYISSSYEYGPADRICTYADGKVVEQGTYIYNEFKYIERKGLLKNHESSEGYGGYDNYVSDEVYELKDGRFYLLYEGHYMKKKEKEGKHTLNWVNTNKEKYHTIIDSCYDVSQEKPIYSDAVSYMDILQMIYQN